ncbi:SIR2 family protein [Cohnella panacarvi]|uniref:SIR2 family protein n=1 Tax=Cohnella panacarvi TaxID=400776 RepID=UPI000479E357|nr:SIR2 family protein [Cohnella panacarvi]
MWITKHIDLPDEIIEAQKKGELVIFAGAGVSTPPPSNLPNFEKLANAIAQGYIPYNKSTSIDTFLGKLLNRGIRVHEKVIELLTSPDSKPCSYHKNIIKLFDKDDIKIVTTNFDDHFRSAAYGLELPIYSAPALPLGRDFTGIIHLHGSVTKRPHDLVITDSDFGRAYFTDGWATTFLRGMFSNYVVLFIGFSANDPVIQYIARGLGSNNRNRYAFTEEGQHEHWNHLQIKYIEYPYSRHQLLEEAIEAWVVRTQMGVFEQRKLIKDIAENPPELNAVDESYIRHQLKDQLGAQHFFEFSKDFQWVEWMDSNNYLDSLFKIDTELTPIKHMQAIWFSSFLGDDSERMLKLIMDKNAIGSYFKDYLMRALQLKSVNLSADHFGKWLPVILNHVNFNRKEDQIEFICKDLEYPKNRDQIIVFIKYLTTPITKYRKKFSLSESNNEFVDVEIEIQGDTYWLRQIWSKYVAPNLDFFSFPILNLLINQLQLVTHLQKATGHGDWDPISFSRSAIEPHEQDRYPDSMDIVIDGCRDSLKYLIDHDVDLASSIINQCFMSDSKLLKRIAIHSFKLLDTITYDGKLQWVIENELLFKSDFKHEVYQLIKHVYFQVTIKSKRQFLKNIKDEFEKKRAVLEDSRKESMDYEEFNLYYWLTVSDENCRLARRAFKDAKRRNKRFEARDEYPDFTHWSSTGGFVRLSSKVTVDKLLSKDPDDPTDLNWLMNYKEKDSFFDRREGFLEVVSSAIATQPAWGWKLMRRLVAPPKKWKTDLWKSVINGLKETNLSNEMWFELSKTLLDHRYLNTLRYEIAYLFDKATKSVGTDFQQSISVIIKIFNKIFNASENSDISATDDPFIQAINHPVGKLTEFFFWVYIESFNDDGANKQIISEIKKDVFSKLINQKNDKAQLGQVILAHRLHIFLSVDEKWSKDNLIPLFDPTYDKEMAIKAWNGYAYGVRWNERILESLFPNLLLILPFTNDMKAKIEESIYRLCSSILLFSTDFHEPLMNHFITSGNGYQLTLLTKELKHNTIQLDEQALLTAWQNWLGNYITARLQNLPVRISDDEILEIIDWVPYVEPVIEEFVNLLVTSRQVRLKNSHFIYQISENELGKRYPFTMLIFLDYILKDTDLAFYAEEAFTIMTHILEALGNKNDHYPIVCEKLMQSNVLRAVELREQYYFKFRS